MEWLILGFPVASLALSFLHYKAELSITNLRSFLAVLELLNDAHTQLPSKNTDPSLARGANWARRFHGFTAAVLAVGGNAAGLAGALSICPLRFAATPRSLYLDVVLALVSLAVLLDTPRWSYRPAAPIDQGFAPD